MRKPIQAIIYILRNNVYTADGQKVPVIKRNYPLDKTPCINIDDSAGTTTIRKRIYNRKINGQNKESLQIRYRTLLNIHLWCDNENQREELSNRITSLFHKAYLDHHEYCLNFDKETGYCRNLDRTCPTLSNEKHLYKSIKNKCPKPLEYGYENIFTHYDLIKSTWDLQIPFSNDNTNTKPPTLHNIFRLNIEYYDYVEIGGIESNNLYYKENQENITP